MANCSSSAPSKESRVLPFPGRGGHREGSGGKSQGELRAQGSPTRKHKESTHLCALQTSPPALSAMTGRSGTHRCANEYPYFLVYFEVYGIVRHARENRDHYSPLYRQGMQPGCGCGPDRERDTQASRLSIQSQGPVALWICRPTHGGKVCKVRDGQEENGEKGTGYTQVKGWWIGSWMVHARVGVKLGSGSWDYQGVRGQT